MDVKRKVEEVLKDYPQLQAEIRIKLIDVYATYSVQSMDYGRMAVGATNNIYSEVENYVTDKLEDEVELQNLIKKKRKIDAALESLPHKYIELIKYRFFEQLTVPEIAYEMDLSNSTLYLYLKDALYRLTRLGVDKL